MGVCKMNNNIAKIYPLTPMQTGMLFHSLEDRDSNVYFIQTSIELSGDIDVDVLVTSFKKLIEKYDVLRTAIVYKDLDKPRQLVLKRRSDDIFLKDISNLNKIEITKYIEDYKVKDRERGFDLADDSLIRMAVIAKQERKIQLILSFHHIILDGWCTGIIIRDLLNNYYYLKNNQPVEIKEIYPYHNYIKWIEKQDKQEAKEYWQEYLEGYDNLASLPKLQERKKDQSYLKKEIISKIDNDLADKLKELAGRNQVTLSTVMQTAWGILLQKYNNTDKVVFGAVVSGRPPEIEGIEEMVGLFINTVPVKIESSLDMSFKELLLSVQKRALLNEKYFYYPLAEIQSSTELKSNLLDHILVFENYPIEQGSFEGDNDIQVTEIESFEQTNYDFNIVIIPGEEMIIKYDFNVAIYGEKLIESTSEYFISILKNVVEDEAIEIRDVNILSQAEKDELLYVLNDTQIDYPNETPIHQLFEKQAKKHSEKIAVVYRGESLTYKDLNEKSNQLARVLRDKGVSSDKIVGMMVDRSLEMIVGILAILKAGGAYLPIDIDYPQNRIEFMLSDSGSDILLMTSNLANQISFSGEMIAIDDNSIYQQEDTSNLVNVNQQSDLAYIIYTSGTTGKPKGVMVEHKNVIRLLFNDRFQFDFDHHDVWTMFHSYCFDFSVWEMYGALLYGGKLVIIPKLVAQDPEKFIEILKDEQVTILNQTPSYFYRLLGSEMKSANNDLNVRYIIYGGEALQTTKLKDWKAKYPQTKLINMYGITETTVHVTYKEITLEEIEKNSNSIGRAIPTLSTYVMDRGMNLLPAGLPGELYVGGLGVTRGYLNREELTKQRFVNNPYKEGERLYATGDLVRMLSNNELEYLGRIDHQEQIRGFRIELGEVESQLLKHEDIKEVTVVAKETDSHKYLVAYLVPERDLSVTELREHLSQELPDYMIPAHFITLAMMPLTSNGKINKKALPEVGGKIQTGVEYLPPENGIEEKLVSVWEDVLGVENIGTQDNFFELGGDSIKAIQVSARLNKYNLKLEIRDLLSKPRIKELSNYVKTEEKKEISNEAIEGQVELAPIQRWFFENDFSKKDQWNQSFMIYRQEGFDEEKVSEVFKKIVEHHDALRMIYQINDKGQITQYNRGLKDKLVEIKIIDLKDHPNIEKIIEKESNLVQASINLEQGPLVKLAQFKTTEGDYLLIVIHHLVVDGVSWRIILEDFSMGYGQLEANQKIKFQDKTLSFQSWSRELKKYANSKEILRQKEYWEKIIEEQEFLKVDRDVEKKLLKDSKNKDLSFSQERTKDLTTRVNKAYNTEINDILLTALGLSIKQWQGLEKIVINLEGHGRENLIKDADITRTVGWFTSQYPVLLEIKKEDNLSYLIKYVKESLRKVPQKGVGYQILKYLSDEEIKEYKNEITFNYLGQFGTEMNNKLFVLADLAHGDPVNLNNEKLSKIDFNGFIIDNQLTFKITYDKYEYKEENIDRLRDLYKENLEKIIRHCIEKDQTEITPSDLGNTELSLEDFEEINNIFQ